MNNGPSKRANFFGGRHSLVHLSMPTNHPSVQGSNPKHTINTFTGNFVLYHCIEKRTKINKKRPGLTLIFYYKKQTYLSAFFVDKNLPFQVEEAKLSHYLSRCFYFPKPTIDNL